MTPSNNNGRIQASSVASRVGLGGYAALVLVFFMTWVVGGIFVDGYHAEPLRRAELYHEGWAVTGILGSMLVVATLALLPVGRVPGWLVALVAVAALVLEVVLSVGVSLHEVSLMTLGAVVLIIAAGAYGMVASARQAVDSSSPARGR